MQPSPALNYYQQFRFEDFTRGVIRIDEDVDDEPVSCWLSEIRNVMSIAPIGADIIVSITSPGGSIYAAFAVYDALTQLAQHRNVICDVQGYAASAAAMIVMQAGSKRVMGPTARILLHEPRSWTGFDTTISNLRDNAKEMEALHARVIDILAARCGRSTEEINALFERKELWLSAEDALKHKLIDEISNDYTLR